MKKKNIIKLIALVYLFVLGCEEEEEGKDSNIIFSISDNGYFSFANYAVFLHDAANPTDLPIATAYLVKGESAVFTRDSLSDLEYAHYVTADASDIEKLIVTTCEYGDLYYDSYYNVYVTNYYCSSNWFVEKGAVWNMMGAFNELDDGDTVLVTIEAPAGKNIEAFYNDIGNSSASTSYYPSWATDPTNFSGLHNVNTVDTEGKITISSVTKMDDDNWYLGVLEDQDWAPGIEFTIDEWQTGMINPLTVNITDTDNIDRFYMWVSRYNDTYSSYDRMVNWRTDYNFDSIEPDTLGSSITVNTTDGIPGADKQRVRCRWRQDEPNYISSYTDNTDYQAGEMMSPKDMSISFDFSSATGTMLNIVADSDIDQARFSFYLLDDGFNSYSWYNYFDPSEGSRFDLPNIGDLNLDIQSVSNVFLEDYDNFDGSADIAKALFEDNNFYSSWTKRHYVYLGGLTDGLLGRQQANNDHEEFDGQELDMFGIEDPRRINK